MLFVISSTASAGAYCNNEKLTSIIVQGEQVYFTTDKSCPNWCQLDPTWSIDAFNRTYSMLLSAQAQKKEVRIYWREHSVACEGPVPTYSKPQNISIF